MSINVPSTDALPLSLTLFDGDAGKFPLAYVTDSSNVAVSGSPFTLTHIANGRYTNNAFTAPSNGKYTAVYITYNEVGHTTIAKKHAQVQDIFEVDDRVSEISATLARANLLETETDALTRDGIAVSERAAIQARADLLQTEADALTRHNTSVSERGSIQTRVDLLETESSANTRDGIAVSERASIQARADLLQTDADAITRFNTTNTNIDANETKIDAIKVVVDTQETKVQADARQSILVAEHNQTQADLAIVDGNVDSIIEDTGTTLPATLATIETKAEADIRQSALIGEHNSTQDTLETQETKVQADARQSALIAEHNTTQDTLATQETKAEADARQVILVAEHDATQDTLATQETKAEADIRQAVLIDEHDATQASLIVTDGKVDSILEDTSTTIPDTLATIETKVQADNRQATLISEHNTTQATLATQETKAQADARQALLISEHNDTRLDIAELQDISITDVQTAMTNQGYTGVRSTNLDNLDATVSSRATQTSVNNIQNSTRFKSTVPDSVSRPTTGSTPYDIYAHLFNTVGTPENPDGDMTLTVKHTNGTIIYGPTAMTVESVGAFKATITIDSADTIGQYILLFDYVEQTVAFQQTGTFKMVEFDSTIENIDSKVNTLITTIGTPVLANVTADINSRQSEAIALSRYNTASLDRAAIQTRVDLLQEETDALARHNTTNANIDTNETKIDTIQATVDTLETKVEADIRQSALISEHDATQATLATQETKAQADARQLALISEHDDTQVTLATIETKAQADVRQATLISEHDDTQATLVTMETKVQADARQVALIGEHDTTQASLSIVDANVDAILEDTSVTLPDTLAGIETKVQADERQAILISKHDATQATLATQETKVQADVRQSALIAEHEDTQVKLVNLDTKVGNPIDTDIATDLANVQARADLLEEESDASIRQAALIAEHDATQATLDAQETKVQADLRQSALISEHNTTQATLATQETKDEADLRQVALIAEHDATQVTLSTQETKAEADARQVILVAEHNQTQSDISALSSTNQGEHDQTQADIADLSTKVGTPSDTDIATDLVNIQTRADLLETESDANTRDGVAVGERAAIQARVDLLQEETDASTRNATAVAERLAIQNRVDLLETTADATTKQNALIGEHNTSQTKIDNLNTKVGTPIDTDVSTDIANVQSRVDLLETAADATSKEINAVNERSNIQTRVNLLEEETDAAARQLASGNERAAIQARVDLLETDADSITRHNSDLAQHTVTQGKVDDLALGSTPLPGEIAQAVWNEIITGGSYPTIGSAGYLQSIMAQQQVVIFDEITASPNSLANIFGEVTNNGTAISNLSSQNAIEKTQLSNQIGLAETNLEGKILDNKADINTTDLNVTNSRVAVIAEVDQNEVKIDALDSKVSGIQNNTDVVIAVPERLVVPDVANSPKTYQLVAETFNDSGAPINADSVPTVKIYNTDGSVHTAEANMVQDGTKVGVYLYDLVITDTQVPKPIRVEFKTIVNTVTKYSQRPSEFVEYDGTLEAIDVKVTQINNTVTDNHNLLTGADGLTQIKTEVLTNRTEINNNETKIDGIKIVTDALPANIATETMTDIIETKVDDLPTNAELTAALALQNVAIKGTGSRDLTEVYDNQRGTDNALLASDPRLDNLDAAISTRSTLTEAEVWSYVNRELTAAAPLSNAEVAKIWDYLTSAISVPGSIGEQIKLTLDDTMSSRSDLSVGDMAILLAPIAKEVTLLGVEATVVTENNENQLLLNDALAFLNNIKPQTDKIVNGGSYEGTVVGTSNQTQADIAALELIVNNIRNKTDNLPVDPAKETSVQSIPTNPLETDDARLDLLNNLPRLDVAVSTRAESIPSDYATKTDVSDIEASIISEVNNNEAKIDSLPGTGYFDPKFGPLLDYTFDFQEIKGSGFNTTNHSLVKIKEGQVSGPGGGTTPQAVWEYADRTLTDYPDFATPDDVNSGNADVVEALSNYSCAMTTTIDSNTDKQTVLCWLNLNGQTVIISENARIEVRDETGILWTGSSSVPDARGVFRIEKTGIASIVNGSNKNYTITITVEYQGQDYSTSQPFYTVG